MSGEPGETESQTELKSITEVDRGTSQWVGCEGEKKREISVNSTVLLLKTSDPLWEFLSRRRRGQGRRYFAETEKIHVFVLAVRLEMPNGHPGHVSQGLLICASGEHSGPERHVCSHQQITGKVLGESKITQARCRREEARGVTPKSFGQAEGEDQQRVWQWEDRHRVWCAPGAGTISGGKACAPARCRRSPGGGQRDGAAGQGQRGQRNMQRLKSCFP